MTKLTTKSPDLRLTIHTGLLTTYKHIFHNFPEYSCMLRISKMWLLSNNALFQKCCTWCIIPIAQYIDLKKNITVQPLMYFRYTYNVAYSVLIHIHEWLLMCAKKGGAVPPICTHHYIQWEGKRDGWGWIERIGCEINTLEPHSMGQLTFSR